MASVTRGITFGATDQVTNTKLHTLVDSATVTSIAQADLTNGEGLVHRGTSAPSDTDQLWVDTSLAPPILKVYDGTSWVPADEYELLTNRNGSSLSVGQVCIVDTTNTESVVKTVTAGDLKFRGIAMETIANTSSGTLKSRGYIPNITLEISASAGCFLRCSSASGKSEPVAATSSGIWGIVTTSGTASAAAYLFGTNLGPISGSIVQVINSISQASASGTTTIPFDNTIPQNTEGDQYLTASITPKSTSNKLRIDTTFVGAHSVATARMIVCLFQDSTANALAVAGFRADEAVTPYTCTFTYYMTAGTTSSTTFKVRAGSNTAGTTYCNSGSGALYNGTLCSSLTITEVSV